MGMAMCSSHLGISSGLLEAASGCGLTLASQHLPHLGRRVPRVLSSNQKLVVALQIVCDQHLEV